LKYIIETKRLILREFNLDDFEFIQKLLNTPKWIKFIGDRGIKSRKDAKKYLINGPLKSYEENGFGLWLVALKTSLLPVGMCGILKREFLEDHDIGFAMLSDYEKNGYGYEAADAAIVFAKDKLKLSRIVGFTLPYNTQSINLLNKLGFKYEKMISMPNDDEELALFTKTF
jgi:RimJ/RimL family protein N-acetyltransferase